MKKFKLHWRTGKPEIVYGPDVATAMNNAGMGRGALPALDYWEEIKDTEQSDTNHARECEKSVDTRLSNGFCEDPE